MQFLNLGLAEFMALLSVTSALVVTLYLLTRARRRQKVATLRFWAHATRPEASQQRRRIQQPLSLLLQLLALALLMLAIAQPRIGGGDSGGRDHVLLLDTSAWMAASGGNRSLMDEARESALAWLARIPPADRVMVVRASGMAEPAIPLTSDREAIRKAISQSRPGAAALNLAGVVAFAEQARRTGSGTPGEIVYVGAGRIQGEAPALEGVKGLRVLSTKRTLENTGLRHIGLRRSALNPGTWEVFVSVRNYGTRAVNVPLVIQFAGSQVGGRNVLLRPSSAQELSFQFRTRAAGWIEARLLTNDALADDNRAVVEIPAQPLLRLAVYTSDPDALRPLLSANPFVEASYRRPSAYAAEDAADVTLLDGFRPAKLPDHPVIWLRPPASPLVQIRAKVSDAPLTKWRAEHELCSGLAPGNVILESADVLAPGPDDVPVAETAAGAVILARNRPQRMVLMGYHPGRSDSRFDVATPLLFANVLRWLRPEALRTWEVRADTVGIVNVPIDPSEDPAQFRVTDTQGRTLPHNVQRRSLRFYSGTPGVVRVAGQRGDRVFSLALPDVGEVRWQPPATAVQALPPRWTGTLPGDIWQWLALAAVAAMAAEWLLYGKTRSAARRVVEIPRREEARKAS
jgi:hypothetical protein